MSYCNIYVQRKNVKNGEVVDSPLHKSLIEYTNNRDTAIKLYSYTFTDFFKNNYKLKTNDYGEVSIDDLIKKVNIPSLLRNTSFLDDVKRKYKLNTSDDNLRKFSSYKEAMDIAYEINVNSLYKNDYTAILSRTEDDKYTVDIRERLLGDEKVSSNMVYNKQLNTHLEGILNSVGLGVGLLSEAEERFFDGTTDFDQMNTVSKGLKKVIRIANNQQGEKALSEEFSHLFVAASKHLSITTRAIKAIKDSGLYTKILGDKLDEYKNEYNNDESLLAEEALGKLLDKKLNAKNNIIEDTESESVNNIFKRF